MQAKTLIALAAASALIGGVTIANAQSSSTNAQDKNAQDTSSSVKSHAAHANTHKKRGTTGMSVPEPGTTQRDKDVHTWATEK
jgi:hypothetical protein